MTKSKGVHKSPAKLLEEKKKLVQETLIGLKSSAEAIGATNVSAKFKDGAIWVEFDLSKAISGRKEVGQKAKGGRHGEGCSVDVARNPDQGTAENRRKTQGGEQKGKPKPLAVQRGDRSAGGVFHALGKRRVRGCGCADCRGESGSRASADPSGDQG